MNKPILKWLPLLGATTLFSVAASAQDNAALINALIKKGVLTQEEAKSIQDEVKKAPPSFVEVRTKAVTRLQLSGRMQAQFDSLATDRPGADPPHTNHFFVRRARLATHAAFGKDWLAHMEYDLANDFFAAFNIQYKGWQDRTLTLGIRKVTFGIEENTSSGRLKAIERSGVTRYFVESNNGRRLGAGSYRTGLFLDGGRGGFFHGVALTNPERTFAPGSLGDRTNNNFAYWANAGYEGKIEGGDFTLGVNLGFLPDQGGKRRGTGSDLTVTNIYAAIDSGNFSLLAEVLTSDNENGAAVGVDSGGWGFLIQPSYKFTKQIEGVVRYSHLDSDGRGIDLSDALRSAPGGGTHDKLTDYYIGGTYYVFGEDLKFQSGFVYGRSRDTLDGRSAEATSYGMRSQVQVNF